VDRFSLFPSLDGLVAHIEWLQQNHEEEQASRSRDRM
jgi:hypothetical protein